MAPSEQKNGPLTLETREIPKLEPGFALVKIEASSVNPLDINHRDGMFVESYRYIMRNDGSGVVEEVGGGVTKLSKGQSKSHRRSVFQAKFAEHRGTFQQYTVVDLPRVAKIPDYISFDGAQPFCSLSRPLQLACTRIMLTAEAPSSPLREPLAAAASFNPIITTASDGNREYSLAAGATCCAPRSPLVAAAIREITKDPVGLIYDAVSSPESQKATWELLVPNGTLIVTLPPAERPPSAICVGLGSVQLAPNEGFGKEMFVALPGLLADGSTYSIKPNRVELVAEGLKGISDAHAKLYKVSAASNLFCTLRKPRKEGPAFAKCWPF
ncbi:chaperonin 10-like protein [Gloeopeniophorella convolvens]|nr:chaperonin 10-like protein [Gloeopeniophorella convolvens]